MSLVFNFFTKLRNEILVIGIYYCPWTIFGISFITTDIPATADVTCDIFGDFQKYLILLIIKSYYKKQNIKETEVYVIADPSLSYQATKNLPLSMDLILI